MAWESLIGYYTGMGLRQEVRRLLQLRCSFHSKAYSGPNVQHASAMENYADDLCGYEAHANSKKRKSTSQESVSRSDLELASHYYSEAHAINTILYGFDNEDVMQTMHKYSEVQERIKSLSFKTRRIRIRGKRSADHLVSCA